MLAENQPASYVKPGVDLSVYNRVMVQPLNMDNIEILKPAWEQDNDEEWSFNPENNIANVKGLFAKWGKKVRMALDKAHGK